MNKLEDMRKEIDKIDVEIIDSFQKRMELSAQIARYKKENALPILDEKREKEKLDTIAKNVDANMSAFTSKLYLTLADLSRDYQNIINSEEK